MNIPFLLLSLFFSFLPVFFWSAILQRKHRSNMRFFFGLNFVLAMAFAALFHHQLEGTVAGWIQGESRHGFRVFVSYMLLGSLIEYGKNFIVRLTGGHYFRSIDDVMDLSFATALGFTFYQNLFHFYVLFQGGYPDLQGPIKMTKEVLETVFFILPIHLFCSGIFGYFYGYSLFASEKLKSEQKAQHWRYKLFQFKTMKIMEGTLISVFFYGLFFTLLKFDPSLQDLFALFGSPHALFGIDEKLMPIVSFFFFGLGTVFLFQLMDQKRELSRKELFRNELTHS